MTFSMDYNGRWHSFIFIGPLALEDRRLDRHDLAVHPGRRQARAIHCQELVNLDPEQPYSLSPGCLR